MRLNSQQLDTLTSSSVFKKLPMLLASDVAEDWQSARDEILKQAASVIAWEAHHRIAHLFDTYGDVLNNFKVEFMLTRSDDYYISKRFYANGAWVGRLYQNPGEFRQYSAMCKVVESVDGGTVFNETCAWLDTIGDNNSDQQDLANQIDVFLTTLSEKDFSSANEARLAARENLPLVDAWVKRHLLSQALEPRVLEDRNLAVPKI